MRNLIFGLMLFSGLVANAQLPAVDIYYGSLSTTDGKWELSGLKNVTARAGYDNQPSFSADGNLIYFTSIRDSFQADIYTYNISTGATTQLTNTLESEYSPVLLSNGKYYSTVRVEKDSSQRLWSFSVSKSKPKLMLEKIDSVGYYCAIDKKRYAFFMVTDTPSLMLADIKKQTGKTIDVNIGRCIKTIPGENAISYIVKTSASEYMIKRFDLTTQTSSLISIIPAVSEDFIWTANGDLLMARDNQLWLYSYSSDSPTWSRIITVKELKGKKIYRLALAADGKSFAFVADE
jgi:hypothetical protein